MKRQEVVDAYLIDVDVKNGVPVPASFPASGSRRSVRPSIPNSANRALFSRLARAAAESNPCIARAR